MSEPDPLRSLFCGISSQLSEHHERTLRNLLRGKQLKPRVIDRLRDPAEIFVELEASGRMSKTDLKLLKNLLKEIDRSPLIKDVEKFEEKLHLESNKRDSGLTEISAGVSSLSLKCDYSKLCLRFKKSLNVNDAFFAPENDICFCTSCHHGRQDTSYYPRGGAPVGWCLFALQVSGRVAALDVFHKWHAAFHGTRPNAVKPIIECDDLNIPGDIQIGGRKPRVFDTNQILLSPSIKYAGLDVFAFPSKFEDNLSKKSYRAKVVFQVWIKPGSYSIGPETMGAVDRIDPLFKNQELEWVTKRSGCILVSGLLVNMQ